MNLEVAWGLLQQTTAQAMKELVTMRESEGRSLAGDLESRVGTLRELVAAIEIRAPERVREAKERLHARVVELLEGEAHVDVGPFTLDFPFEESFYMDI